MCGAAQVAIALTAAAVYFVEHGAVAFGTFLSDGPLGRVRAGWPWVRRVRATPHQLCAKGACGRMIFSF